MIKLIRHLPQSNLSIGRGAAWVRCGKRVDIYNTVAIKKSQITCPECIELRKLDRAKAKARLAEMLAEPRKGPLRKPLVPFVEDVRKWTPSGRHR